MRTIALFAFLVGGLSAAEFFAPAQPSGSVALSICPTEGITGSKLVTFGMPFTRGSVTEAQLANVRLMTGTTEVPAFVESLTPWRHFTDTAIDGQSVRVARVQFTWTITAAFPACDTATLEWGGQARTQDIATLTDPRTAWHSVVDVRWGTTSQVSEPDVFVLLPKAHLVKGALNFQHGVPFDDSISETRDDPQTIKDGDAAASVEKRWQYYWKNNFFSHIGEDVLTDLHQQAQWKADKLTFTVNPATNLFTLDQDWPFWIPNEDIRMAGALGSVAPGGWAKAQVSYLSLTNADGSPLLARQFYASSTHPVTTNKTFTATIGATDLAVTLASVSGLPTTFPYFAAVQALTGWVNPTGPLVEWVKVTGAAGNLVTIERGQFGSTAVGHLGNVAGSGHRFIFYGGGTPREITTTGSGSLWIPAAFEPWLFDRVSAMYQLYFSSGFLRPLREAVRQSEHYRNLLLTTAEHATRAGAFSPKCDVNYWPDNQNCSIYSSNEGLAYTYWLTGDNTTLSYVNLIKKFFDNVGSLIAWDVATAFAKPIKVWTERSTGLRLKSLVIDYEVNGTADSKTQIQQAVVNLTDHQAGRAGTVPNPFMPGGLWHSYRQHEWDNACLTQDPDCTIASAWMSVLTVGPLIRVYGVTESPAVREIVTGLGALFTATAQTGGLASPGWTGYCAWETEPIAGIGTLCPQLWAYITNREGEPHAASGSNPTTEQGHAPDIASLICWSAYFSGKAEEKALCEATYKAATGMWAYFNRPQASPGFLTEYRLSRGVARQFNWQFANANAVMWLNTPEPPPPPIPDAKLTCTFEAGGIGAEILFRCKVQK